MQHFSNLAEVHVSVFMVWKENPYPETEIKLSIALKILYGLRYSIRVEKKKINKKRERERKKKLKSLSS